MDVHHKKTLKQKRSDAMHATVVTSMGKSSAHTWCVFEVVRLS